MNQIEVKSYAKINLGLQVLNKRNDGFHNINTIFSKISLHDTLKFTKNNSGTINFKSNIDLPASTNSIINITKIIKNNYKLENVGLEIELKKKIPIGGGLGGGSSNAAYTLIALDKLFGLEIPKNEKYQIAEAHGSDTPFFLDKGMAKGSGRGEVLDFFSFNPDWIILVVNPGIHVSTPEAYKALNRNEQVIESVDFKSIILEGNSNPEILKQKIFNDFETAIFGKHDEIRQIKEELYDMGAFFALMSGSGATVFGLFKKIDDALKAKSRFNTHFCELSRFVD